jgi:hypothetical protein
MEKRLKSAGLIAFCVGAAMFVTSGSGITGAVIGVSAGKGAAGMAGAIVMFLSVLAFLVGSTIESKVKEGEKPEQKETSPLGVQLYNSTSKSLMRHERKEKRRRRRPPTLNLPTYQETGISPQKKSVYTMIKDYVIKRPYKTKK